MTSDPRTPLPVVGGRGDLFVPTLHVQSGYVFEMVMFDCRERRHVHVRGNGTGGAKLWLEPAVEVASAGGYNARESRQIARIISDNLEMLIRRWDEECARVEAQGRTP